MQPYKTMFPFTLGLGIFLSNIKRVFSESIKALTIILSVCNMQPSISPENASTVLYGNTGIHSVKGLMSYCSAKKYLLEPYVFPQYVHIPCPEDIFSCNVNSWAIRADDALRPLIDIDNYIYKIYILPKGGCNFAGLGVKGPCSKNNKCRIWISGDYPFFPAVYFHELGHNLGLHHSSFQGDEYGDFSDIMGYCCKNRCFSAPHNNKLNISSPLHSYTLPSTSNESLLLLPNEYILVLDPETQTKWFVQNRQTNNIEDIPSPFTNSINIYSLPYSSLLPNSSSAQNVGTSTLHITLHKPLETFFIHNSFTVTLIDMSNNSAKIQLN
jgi:hypothetical protein